MSTRWTAFAVLGCLAVAGCGTPSSSGAGPSQATAPTTPGSLTSRLQCPALSPQQLPTTKLRASDTVAAALLCRTANEQRPGQGEVLLRREGRPRGAALQQLAAAFRLPDIPPTSRDITCPAVGYLTPDLQFQLTDGRVVRVAYPHDGCGAPLPQVTTALSSAITGPDVTVVLVRRLRSQAATTAQCETQWKDVFAPPLHQPGPGVMPAPTAPRARVGVCRYTARNGALTLVASGLTDGDHVSGLRLRPGAGSCPGNIHGAVLLQELGATTRPLLWIETAGCGRVLDSNAFRDLGYLPPGQINATSALANTTEPP